MATDKFGQAYTLWREAPFPAGSTDDGLDEVHAHLAYADAMVAEAAIPIADGRASKGEVPDQVLVELASIEGRASRYMGTADAETARLAVEYQRYAELLLRVVSELG